jgi:serine/threonine protein kinase
MVDDSADQEDRVGEVFASRYQLEAVLGRGAAGVVYDATDRQLGRGVAVKVLASSSMGRRATAYERFRLEAGVLAQIAHPNIVAILDLGTTSDGVPYLVMERLSGQTLDERLGERGVMSPGELFQIGAQLCRALRRVHARGVVHRDLKPANIIIHEDIDGTLHAKIIDFGVARLIEPSAEDASEVPTHLTSPGNLVGSPTYMSPEQIVGDEVDARSDIYALGVTFFQLLTGRPPYQGRHMMDLLRQHLQAGPPPKLGVPCPPALERLVLRCLSRFPDQRPASMDEVLRELRAAWQEYSLEPDLAVLPPIVRWDTGAVETAGLPALKGEPEVVLKVEHALSEAIVPAGGMNAPAGATAALHATTLPTNFAQPLLVSEPPSLPRRSSFLCRGITAALVVVAVLLVAASAASYSP